MLKLKYNKYFSIISYQHLNNKSAITVSTSFVLIRSMKTFFKHLNEEILVQILKVYIPKAKK